MSGGVDSSAVLVRSATYWKNSSATAYLLKKEGYDVFGMTMDLLLPPYAPTVSSIADAAVVAEKLGIPHYFLGLHATG